MWYFIALSDGTMHESLTAEEHIDLLDKHGAEVVDSFGPEDIFEITGHDITGTFH